MTTRTQTREEANTTLTRHAAQQAALDAKLRRRPTKSDMFKAAWLLARKGAEKFGGSPKEYFSEALREAWGVYKAAHAKLDAIIAAAA